MASGNAPGDSSPANGEREIFGAFPKKKIICGNAGEF